MLPSVMAHVPGECEYENVDHRLSRRFRLDPHPVLPALVDEVCSLDLNLNRSLVRVPLPLLSFFLLFARAPSLTETLF